MDLNPMKWLRGASTMPTTDASGAAELVAALEVRPANPRRGDRLQHIGRNNAGVHVNHITAFQVATVWACMDVIAASLASSDWNLYAGGRGDENKEALTGDAVQYMLNERWNPEMTAQSGKRAVLLCAIGFGTGYAEIEWDRAGRPVALWPILSARVEPRRDLDEVGNLFYRVQQDGLGGSVDMSPRDMLVIKGATLDGLAGEDPVARAVQSIAMAIALDQFGAAFFANGTQVGGILNSANKLDDPAYERLAKQWNQKHAGARNANKTAILDGGVVTYTPFSVDAQKSQVVESKYQQVEEICRAFRVPPHKVGHLLRATNNNIEHQGLEFVRDTLRPWKIEIEQETSYKLIPWRVRKFVEIDLDWASEGDYGSRMTAYSVARAMGVFSVNDVLRKLGENTIGPEGDKRTMNGASVLLEDVGKNMLPAASTAAPAVDTGGNANDPTTPDEAATAWLTSIYARGLRRMENRQAGRPAAEASKIRAEALAYTTTECGELLAVAGAEYGSAVLAGAEKVLDGTDPNAAARAALTKE